MSHRTLLALSLTVATLICACSAPPFEVPPPPPPPGFSVSPTSLILTLDPSGGTNTGAQLSAYLSGQPVSSVVWVTSSAAIATVTSDGWVTAMAPGDATITAHSGTNMATARVTVRLRLAPR